MRLTTLLLLLVALLLLTAPAASFAQTVSPKSNPPFTGDSAAIIRAYGSTPSMSVSDDPRGPRNFDSGDSHVTCLTMRTYVVARENPNSDVTHPVRYYECVPAWKFDIRTSGQKHPGALP